MKGKTQGEIAAIVRGTKQQNAIIDGMIALVRPHVKTIKELDPEAQVGVRGSLIRGQKGRHKKHVPFDPKDFDIDAFIVSDKLAAQYDKFKKFRDGSDIYPIKRIQTSIDNSMRGNEPFNGLRKTRTTKAGRIVPDKFTFRIFTQEEMQNFIKQYDSQLYFME